MSRFIPVLLALLCSTARATPPIVNIPGRITSDFIGIRELGRGVWVQSYNRAKDLLDKLEATLRAQLEEHERQCFLQEALKHFIPEAKDGTKITGAPQGDVTPELMERVLKRLDNVNRCTSTNRGYLAFHAWKGTGFQEPRKLPSGQEMTLADFLRAVSAMGVGVGETAPAAATGLLPVVSPGLVPAAMPRQGPKPGEVL